MLASIVAILVFTHLADASPFIRRQRNSQSEAYAFFMTESSGTIVDDYETRQLLTHIPESSIVRMLRCPSQSPNESAPTTSPSSIFAASAFDSNLPSDFPSVGFNNVQVVVQSDSPSTVPSSAPSDTPSRLPSLQPSRAALDTPSDEPSSAPLVTPLSAGDVAAGILDTPNARNSDTDVSSSGTLSRNAAVGISVSVLLAALAVVAAFIVRRKLSRDADPDRKVLLGA